MSRLKALKVRLACNEASCEEEMDAAIEKAAGAPVDWAWAAKIRAAGADEPVSDEL